MKVMVTGAAGMLALAAIDQLRRRGHDAVPFDRAALDVTDAAAVLASVRRTAPDAVIQCAAWTAVDDAETRVAEAFAVNADATANVARACVQTGARLVYPSTDYVFDGNARSPWKPDAPTSPVNEYGRSKLAGEQAAQTADALVVRTSWLYGAGGPNFVRTMIDLGRAGRPLRVVDDQHGAPTSTVDLATMMVLLLERAAPAGVYHATNAGQTTWHGLACAALQCAGIAAEVDRASSADFPRPARRPAYSVLDCSSTYAITGAAPHWRDALAERVAEGL